VVLILEDAADPSLFYVVSLYEVAFQKMPEMIRLDPLWRIVDFDDSPGKDGDCGRVRVRA